MKKHVGFTLAEVLITLGIIGVVAAMTIPTLMSKTNDAELKTALKKNFSVFSQVFTSMLQDYGGSMSGALSDGDHAGLQTETGKYLNYVKTCSDSSTDGCWHTANNWHYHDGTNSLSGSSYPGFILKDGTLVLFAWQTSACTSTISDGSNYSYTRCGVFLLDVNGFKNPNTIGKDIFAFNILPTQLLPHGANPITSAKVCSGTGSTGDDTQGWSCTVNYLYQ